jgi:hypothetical protein
LTLPINPLDLIRWEENAPRCIDLPQWWDHYKEARTFFLVCSAHLARTLGLNSRTALHRFIRPARQEIAKTKWAESLESTHWRKLHPNQIRAVLEERPLCLVKALMVGVVIYKYVESKDAEAAKTYFDHVYIQPAMYKVPGWTPKHLDDVRTAHKDRYEALLKELHTLGQPHGQKILTEMAALGSSTCFATAMAVAKLNGINGEELSVVLQERRGSSAGIKPSSGHLMYPC